MTIFTSKLDFWLHQVNEFLWASSEKAHTNQINKLCELNDKLHPHPTYGFSYQGLVYRSLGLPAGTAPFYEATRVNPLDPSLQPEMTKILSEAAEVHTDLRKIRQENLVALRLCETQSEARDCLPDCVHPAFDKTEHASVFSKPRTRPVGWTTADDSKLAQRYAWAVDRMTYHATMRLIYS